MANINKIRLSGQTYNIQDENASKTVELTQAQYDALTVKDPNTFYVITDAQGADLSQYYTSAQTESAITAAVSGKQDTLVSGTNIKTINNESLLGSGNIEIQGGGGKAIEAGRGISITTGETADTVSFNLPLSASSRSTDSVVGGYFGNTSMAQYGFAFGDNAKCGNSGSACIALGRNVTANGNGALALGYGNTAKKTSAAIGKNISTNIDGEIGVGQYNVSSSGSSTFGDSGNTLFSVGNGTADNARHNAFEIRQNGDIYCSDGTNDVKLQDTITATAANTTALGGLSIVKLTESEYTALVTKDSNTLYVVVPDPSN